MLSIKMWSKYKFPEIMQFIFEFLPQYITTLAYRQNAAWSKRWLYEEGVLNFKYINRKISQGLKNTKTS